MLNKDLAGPSLRYGKPARSEVRKNTSLVVVVSQLGFDGLRFRRSWTAAGGSPTAAHQNQMDSVVANTRIGIWVGQAKTPLNSQGGEMTLVALIATGFS